MKNSMFLLRRNLTRASALVLLGLLLFACKKSNEISENIPVGHLMAFNLVPDKAAIGIALSGNLLTQSPLNYAGYTGGYLNIYPGSREIKSYDYSTGESLATTTYSFDSSKYYSMFTLGTVGAYQNLVTLDNFDSLSNTSGKAYVRYINAVNVANPVAVNIKSNGTDIINTSAAFATASAFTAAVPGEVEVSINNDGNVNATRKITLEQNRLYTILLTGVPGSAETGKAVQIRFVENGSL